MSDVNSNHRDTDTRRRTHHKRHEKYMKYTSSKKHREHERPSSDESEVDEEVAIDIGRVQKGGGQATQISREPNDYERYMNRVRDTPDGDCFNWTGLGLIVFLVLMMIVVVCFRDGLDHPHSILGEHHDLDDSHKILTDSLDANVNTH